MVVGFPACITGHMTSLKAEGSASGGVCMLGCLPPGGLHPREGGGVVQASPELAKWAVCIILECFLVVYCTVRKTLHLCQINHS